MDDLKKDVGRVKFPNLEQKLTRPETSVYQVKDPLLYAKLSTNKVAYFFGKKINPERREYYENAFLKYGKIMTRNKDSGYHAKLQTGQGHQIPISTAAPKDADPYVFEHEGFHNLVTTISHNHSISGDDIYHRLNSEIHPQTINLLTSSLEKYRGYNNDNGIHKEYITGLRDALVHKDWRDKVLESLPESQRQAAHTRMKTDFMKVRQAAESLHLSDFQKEIDQKAQKIMKSTGVEILGKGQNGSWQNEGYKLCYVCGAPNVKKTGADHGVLMIGRHAVFALDKSGKYVGHAEFGDDGKVLFPTDTKVKEEHRRKGLATAMYKLAEEKAKKVIDKSYVQSADAKALWAQKNRPFGKSEGETEKLEKWEERNGTWYPEKTDKDGEPNPSNPRIVKHTAKNGRPVGATTQATRKEDINKLHNSLPSFLRASNLSEKGKETLGNLVDQIIKDPDSHAQGGGTTSSNLSDHTTELRLRHLNNLFSGREGYELSETKEGLSVIAPRHSKSDKSQISGRHHWHIDHKNKTLKFLGEVPNSSVGGGDENQIDQNRIRGGRVSIPGAAGGVSGGSYGGAGRKDGSPVSSGESRAGGAGGVSPGKLPIERVSSGVVKRVKKSDDDPVTGKSNVDRVEKSDEIPKREVFSGESEKNRGRVGSGRGVLGKTRKQPEGILRRNEQGREAVLGGRGKESGLEGGKTSLIKLLQRLRKDGLPGGKGDDKPDSSFDPKELEMGITVESEHTSDPNIAKEVAKDHLTENPKYYSKLKDSGLADELKKAVHPKDMTRIQNKTDSSGDSVVDITEHSKIKPDHLYTSMMNSPNVNKGEGIRQFGGISAKMVHKIKRSGVPGDEDTYMAKPYHKKIESATRSWIKNPILGWSTMATRNLMHAAGMGENTENVSVHTHNGVPLTVHKFDKNVKPINENLESGSFHGTLRGADDNTAIQAKKIAIMDFLTGNLDRHYGNLMYDPANKKLLAIDHERSFQYAKPHDKGESPLSYLAGSSLNTAVRNKNTPYDHADELADWWNSSKDNIKTALDKELAHIKDPHIKDHIEQNFNKRHEQLSDFFQHDSWSVFTRNFPNVDLYSKKLPKQDINTIVSNMPHEDKHAVRYIDNVLSKKKGAATASTLLDLWKISLGRMSPSDIADYYHSNPYHHLANHEHGATYGLLTHLSETGNKKAMAELLKRGGLPPFWEDRFKEEVKK